MTKITGTEKQISYAADLYEQATEGQQCVADLIAMITDSAAVRIAFLKSDGFEYTVNMSGLAEKFRAQVSARATEYVTWPIHDCTYLPWLAKAIDDAEHSVERNRDLIIKFASVPERVATYTERLKKAEEKLAILVESAIHPIR